MNAATDILSLSGYGCMCLDKVLPDADGAPALDTANPGFGGNRAYNAQLFQAGVSSGANTWDFNLVLPIAINFQDPIGLLLLQSPEISSSCDSYSVYEPSGVMHNSHWSCHLIAYCFVVATGWPF